MKTFKLKFLFTLLVTTGLLLSCSSDDDAVVADDPVTPTTRTTATQFTTPLDLSFTTSLETFSEEDGCGEGIYLFQHSGQGTNELTGDFSIDLSYCGQPRSFAIHDLQLTLENTDGDKIFLTQSASPDVQDPSFGGIVDVDTPVSGEVQNPGEASEPNGVLEDGLLVMEITGGTGAFANAQGQLSSRISPSFVAGADDVNFVFAGFVSGI